MFMREVDEKDRELLTLLRHNSRASVTELSARLGLTRATVNSRMAALKRDGVIRRFTVDLAETVDEDVVKALSLFELNLAQVDRVHRDLARMPELTSIHTTNGKWALVVRSETRSLTAFDRLLNRMGKLDGVVNIETCLLLSRVA